MFFRNITIFTLIAFTYASERPSVFDGGGWQNESSELKAQVRKLEEEVERLRETLALHLTLCQLFPQVFKVTPRGFGRKWVVDLSHSFRYNVRKNAQVGPLMHFSELSGDPLAHWKKNSDRLYIKSERVWFKLLGGELHEYLPGPEETILTILQKIQRSDDPVEKIFYSEYIEKRMEHNEL